MEQLESTFKEQSRDKVRTMFNIQYGYPKRYQRLGSCYLSSQKSPASDNP